MERRSIVPCILLLLFLLAAPVRAGIDATFIDDDLDWALHKVALQAGETLITTGDLAGTVTAALRGVPFEEALDRILAGTGYRWTKADGFYLAGRLSPDAPQFSALAITRAYPLTYITAGRAMELLKDAPAHIGRHPDRELLLITALPRDLEAIEAQLAVLDSPENPYQVAASFVIVEIDERRAQRLGLGELAVSAPGDDALLQFTSREGIVEVLGTGILDRLQLALSEEHAASKRTTGPALVVALGETGRLAMLQEEVYILEETGRYDLLEGGLELHLTPERYDADHRVKSRVAIEAPGAARLATTLWSEPGHAQLVGLLSGTESREARGLLSRETVERERHVAVYLQAEPVGTLTAGDGLRAGSLEGLGELVSPFAIPPPLRPEYLQVGYGLGEPGGPEVEAYWTLGERAGVGAGLSGGGTRAHFGLDLRLFEDLKLAGTFHLREGEAPLLGLGINERVQILEDLALAAGYYADLLDTDTFELAGENAWWIELELRERRGFVRLRAEDIIERSYRGTVGYGIGDAEQALIGYGTDPDGASTYYLGLRWEFWE